MQPWPSKLDPDEVQEHDRRREEKRAALVTAANLNPDQARRLDLLVESMNTRMEEAFVKWVAPAATQNRLPDPQSFEKYLLSHGGALGEAERVLRELTPAAARKVSRFILPDQLSLLNQQRLELTTSESYEKLTEEVNKTILAEADVEKK